MTSPLAMTPASYLQGMLVQVAEQSVQGAPDVIAGLLDNIAPTFADLGRRDLAPRIGVTSQALRSGDFQRTDWLQSRLYGELEAMKQALDTGASLDDALHLRSEASALQGLAAGAGSARAAKPGRPQIGPEPTIRWADFGTKGHPAPNPPSKDIITAGKRLSYFFYYVAGVSGHGETEGAAEDFFGISERVRRRIRDGRFAHEKIGQFPSADAASLIRKSREVEPKYGDLMVRLVVHAFFESQAWSLGTPTKDAHWTLGLLHGLRQFVGCRLLDEEGKKEVLADKPLIRVVRGQVSLNDVNWHVLSGKTRRQVFEPWLTSLSRGNAEKFALQCRTIGDGLLRENGWAAPKPERPSEFRLQWLVRYWMAHAHFGAIPAVGLPVSPEKVMDFALAGHPADIGPGFRAGLLTLMEGFYTEAELAALDITERAGRGA